MSSRSEELLARDALPQLVVPACERCGWRHTADVPVDEASAVFAEHDCVVEPETRSRPHSRRSTC